MIPPKGEWHRFKDNLEKLEYLQLMELIPKTKDSKPIYYSGPYVNSTVECDVVGYVDPYTTVIELDGELHCIHPDLLFEMQTLNIPSEYKINYIRNPSRSPMSFVVFDFETTNLSHRLAEIIEIGAVKYEDGKKTESFQELVRPNSPIPSRIEKLTHITNEMVSDKPSIEKVLPLFIEFIGSLPLIAYNGAAYDIKILERKCFELQIPFSADGYDAMQVAKKTLKCPAGNKLEEMVDYYSLGGICHRALADAEATAKIWEMCFPSQFVVSAASLTPTVKNKGPAQWSETLMIQNDIISSLTFTGLNYDLSAVQSENRPQKNGETEAVTIMGNTVCVLKGKRKKDVSFTVRFQKILDSVGAQYRQLSDGLRITPLELTALLSSTELAQLLYEACLSDAESFSCCADYEKCSDAKKCIQTDPMFYGRCHYRDNLKSGKIFYGKNKTI